MPRAIKATEAARRLNVDKTTIYRWIREGTLAGHKVGGRVLIARSDFEALLTPHGAHDCPYCRCQGVA